MKEMEKQLTGGERIIKRENKNLLNSVKCCKEVKGNQE